MTTALTACAEKRHSIEGLVDGVSPRPSSDIQDLPIYNEKHQESNEESLQEKLVTCFWIACNTLSTLGIVFLSKRYAAA